MLKAIIRQNTGTDRVRHRIIKPDVVSDCSRKLNEIDIDVLAVLKEEIEEKAVQRAEMEIRKGENLIEHEKEIFSRPARTWFQSGKEKDESQSGYSADAKALSDGYFSPEISRRHHEEKFPTRKRKSEFDQEIGSKRPKHAGLSRKAKRRKQSMEEDAGTERALNASIRQAKKLSRPVKIGEIDERLPGHRLKGSKKSKRNTGRARKGVGFEHDMGSRG